MKIIDRYEVKNFVRVTTAWAKEEEIIYPDKFNGSREIGLIGYEHARYVVWLSAGIDHTKKILVQITEDLPSEEEEFEKELEEIYKDSIKRAREGEIRSISLYLDDPINSTQF